MTLNGDDERDRPGRVAAVRETLFLLWGDEMPPGPDPLRTLFADGTLIDDANGRRGDLVVQGDGLTLAVLRRVVARADDPAVVLELLPEDLAARIRATDGG